MSDFIEIAKVLTLLCIPILAVGAAVPLGRALAARLSRNEDHSPSDLDALEARLTSRLFRLEQAVDAVSLEVERVGESQRYAARLVGAPTLVRSAEPSDGGRRTTPQPQ